MIKEFLIAKVGENYFAIDIFKIEQVVKYQKPTRIVGSPKSMAGVTNIFDKLWNIVDLKHLYYNEFIVNNNSIEENADDQKKIILLVDGTVGLLVENVFTIEKIEEKDIKKVDLKNNKQEVINLPNIIASIMSVPEIYEKLKE